MKDRDYWQARLAEVNSKLNHVQGWLLGHGWWPGREPWIRSLSGRARHKLLIEHRARDKQLRHKREQRDKLLARVAYISDRLDVLKNRTMWDRLK